MDCRVKPGNDDTGTKRSLVMPGLDPGIHLGKSLMEQLHGLPGRARQ